MFWKKKEKFEPYVCTICESYVNDKNLSAGNNICAACYYNAEYTIERLSQIINDSYEILLKTKNIDTFKSRYQLIESKYETLSKYQIFISKSIEEIKEINNPRISLALLRIAYYENDKCLETIERLKSSNAKVNKINKILDKINSLDKYFAVNSDLEAYKNILANLIALRNSFDK